MIGSQESGSKADIDQLSNVICYQTPTLPSWQDMSWPFRDGDFCVFHKIASKLDYLSQEEFIESFANEDQQNTDLVCLWDSLPSKEIMDLESGNYSISVYLFTREGKKVSIWDAS